MKNMLGVLDFVPGKDDFGKPISVYRGTIVGYIVRRDDGSEFEVRQEGEFDKSNSGLVWNDIKTLKEGEPIVLIKEPLAQWVIAKVFPTHGDVWIMNETTKRQKAVKYYELRRHK